MISKSFNRVLIVEDERTLKMAIQKKLEKTGFETVAATSAEEALELLQDPKNRPDVIWLDYYLPSMNGLEFLTKIKENPKYKSIPVFVVSNTAGPEKVATMMALGVHKYFIKAEKRLDEIIYEINRLLSKRGKK